MDKILVITEEKDLRRLIREEMQAKKQEDPENEIKSRMSRREAAKFLDVSYQTVYNWLKAGILKEHGIGKSKFFLKAELIEALKNN